MDNTQYRNFGEFLQRKREERKITLRAMAGFLNFSAPFLSDVEKDRRNPPELNKLEQIAILLGLDAEEKQTMFDLAGKKRVVAPDLPDYINQHDFVRSALRTARDLDAGEEEWQRFIEELRQRKGE